MSITYVGSGSDHVAGRVVIYCNGINNSQAEAQKTGDFISQLFKQKVGVFHNPTRVVLGGRNDMKNEMYQRGIKDALVSEIRDALSGGARLVLLAHSHGAVVCHSALYSMALEAAHSNMASVANRIHLYTFGGAVMVASKAEDLKGEGQYELAARAENYVIEQDEVPNVEGGMNEFLYTTRKVRADLTDPFVDLGSSMVTVLGKNMTFSNILMCLFFKGRSLKLLIYLMSKKKTVLARKHGPFLKQWES